LYEALASRVGRTLKGRVGIQEQYLPVGELNKLKKLFRTAKFVPTAGLVESLAAVKDDDEIAKIRAAVKLTDEVFDEVLAFIKPGVKELDIAAEVSYRHRLKGAEADAFEPIVASGVRGALPHARATRKTIRKGEMVTLDMGCRLNGYHSDLTRTVAVGKPPAELRRVYGIVREAQQRAVDAAAGGLSARALDAVARSFIRRHGYGTYFNHSLGHGLGLQVHEAPRLSKLSKETLASGNVVTIEPGIYIPNLGGVRIEDDVVIRNGTADVLNRAPKELLIL
jgi:Xaa-Pro aminopeptidase